MSELNRRRWEDRCVTDFVAVPNAQSCNYSKLRVHYRRMNT